MTFCPNCNRPVRYGSEHARDNGSRESCNWVCESYIRSGRDPSRIRRVLSLLEEYWTRYPDLRLGQIIMNFTPRFPCDMGCKGNIHPDECSFWKRDPYNLEESHWEKALQQALAEKGDL